MYRKNRFLGLMVLFFGICVAGLFAPTDINTDAKDPALNYGDIAWMLTAAGLVLLMTPGLSFFLWRYGEQEEYHFYHVTELYCIGCYHRTLCGSGF